VEVLRFKEFSFDRLAVAGQVPTTFGCGESAAGTAPV